MKSQPRRDVIVIYGLPGAGKTSLCRYIGKNIPGYYYADVTSHPCYGAETMVRCVADLYVRDGVGKNLITEGVLREPDVRNRFANNLRRTLSSETRYSFRAPKLVFVEEVMKTLSERRNHRSPEEYQAMRSDFSVGSGRFPHGVLDGEAYKSLAERAQWIVENINTMAIDAMGCDPASLGEA